MYGCSCGRDLCMKNFRFNTICNITEKNSITIEIHCARGSIGISGVISSIVVKS